MTSLFIGLTEALRGLKGLIPEFGLVSIIKNIYRKKYVWGVKPLQALQTRRL